jgi:hypothetical protein
MVVLALPEALPSSASSSAPSLGANAIRPYAAIGADHQHVGAYRMSGRIAYAALDRPRSALIISMSGRIAYRRDSQR